MYIGVLNATQLPVILKRFKDSVSTQLRKIKLEWKKNLIKSVANNQIKTIVKCNHLQRQNAIELNHLSPIQ